MIIITIRLDSQQNQLQFIVDFLHFSLWFFFTVFSFFGLSSIDLRMTITVRIFESLPVSGPQSFIHCPFLDLFCIFRLFFSVLSRISQPPNMTPRPPEIGGKQVIGLFSPCSRFHSCWNGNFYLWISCIRQRIKGWNVKGKIFCHTMD